MNDDLDSRRVKFFGVRDLGASLFVGRVAEIVEAFDPSNAPGETADVIELFNVQQYLENEMLPRSYTDQQRESATAQLPNIRSAVGKFFGAIDETSVASLLTDIPYEYHADLLELLARSKAFERCTSGAMLPALGLAGVHLGEMLACQRLVDNYDLELREEILKSPQNAEHLIRKFLQKGVEGEVHLPASLNSADMRGLLVSYLESPDPNLNYVGLIETARPNPEIGLDARLKLQAKQRKDEKTAAFFKQNVGIRTGTEISVSETQSDPEKFEVDDSDGLVTRLTYSSQWLKESCDYPSILNNFQHLFHFTDHQVLLQMPSYPALMGVIERTIGTTGKSDYQKGAVYRATDQRTLLQTHFYRGFLETQEIDLEAVISWFFETYLLEEFGAQNFSFAISGSGTTYLQKVRNLFAEMESVASQFALFVEDGELDRELLAMSSNGVPYKLLPSLLEGKYVYPTNSDEMARILHCLFSDQSSLNYIRPDLRGDDLAHLLITNQVSYDEFHDYQKPMLDRLIELEVLEDTGQRLQFQSTDQFLILMSLYQTEAANYYHLDEPGRAEVDAMVDKGWVTRSSSLLTEAEGQYFNYFLNQADFSNGPDLRNKYLHGSQPNTEDGAHFEVYLQALRLTVALVLKINDDFCQWAVEKERIPASK